VRPKHFHPIFHPVVKLPGAYDVYDFTAGYDPDRPRRAYGVGRYDEVRPGMYTAAQFGGSRCVHMGIDLGCPAGESVHAFAPGTIWRQRDNAAEGDYGPTIVTKHETGGRPIWVLLGHLSRESLELHREGESISAGEMLGFAGEKHENGGWNPHVHVQLCLEPPEVADLPGVVAEADHEAARQKYPDPRLILGPLY
jgi:murein DD-endopeptidase MepM/ murein hydrolase activator NlpD